jgi:uncharacterized phage protein gp47/JayE
MRDLDVGGLGVVVDDRDPQAIFEDMVAVVRARIPGWQPRNGSLDTVLLEAWAVADADLVYALNRTLGALVEAILAIDGVARDDGEPATGIVDLVFDGTDTRTVSAGTQFVTDSDDDPVTLVAVADTAIASDVGAVDVAEATPGAGSLLTAGQPVSPAAGIPRLSAATLRAPLAGGRPAETDWAYLERAVMRRARHTSSLVLPDHFTAYTLEDPRVGRATTIDLYDPDTGAGAPGHVTVVVHGRGDPLGADVLAELEQAMNAMSAAILTVHVVAAQLATVDVSATVTVAPGYTLGDVTDAADAAVGDWLSWRNSGFGQTVTPDAIESVVSGVAGVASVTVTAPAGPVGHAVDELPVAGTVSIA